jgi:hypothetical protein
MVTQTHVKETVISRMYLKRRNVSYRATDVTEAVLFSHGVRLSSLVLRPLFGLLYQPQMMIVEQSVECELA